MEVAAYDKTKPLIIDPTLSYSTFLGGGDTDEDHGIAVDTSGNAYVTGLTCSTDFPTMNPLQPTPGGSRDAFVTKFDAAGAALVYSTYLGGEANDYGRDIAVDGSGNVYVTGPTDSSEFPTTLGAFQTICGIIPNGACSGDAFMAKLNPDGTGLSYSTFLGGTYPDVAMGIAVDSSGNAYVTGTTYSPGFPTVAAYDPSCGIDGYCDAHSDVFVAKIDPSAQGAASLVYSTFLGGSGYEYPMDIALDAVGNAYIIAYTDSADFPTTSGAFQETLAGSYDACVSKLDPATPGSAGLIYSTFLGGNGGDVGKAIAVDGFGNAYVTGGTYSTDFPRTAGVVQPACALNIYEECADSFITKLNDTGSGLVYSTFLGGSDYDYGEGIALDAAGNAYVTGTTRSSDFPTASPLQGSAGGGTCEGPCSDAFVTKLNAAGTAFIFSSYLGGDNDDYGYAIALDSSGNAYLAGNTYAEGFPTTPGAFQPACNLGPYGYCGDAFAAKLSGLALPVVTLSPTALDFGSLGVGFTSPAKTVTLTNNGDALLTISGIVASGDFAVAGSTTCPSGGTVAAGASCTIDVTFTPAAVGPRSGDVTITSEAPSSPGLLSLRGTGVAAPAVLLLPSSLAFGNQDIGTTSPAQPVTLTNTGTAPMTITSIATTTPFGQSNDCPVPPASLAVGVFCTINVTFAPTATGAVVGSLEVTDDAPGSPHVLSLTGTGVIPAVALTPTSLSFPKQRIEAICDPQTVTLKNTGTGTLEIAGITTSGQFVQSNTCGASLAAGASCLITVTYKPTTVGDHRGAVTITDNAPDSPQTVSLSGTATLICLTLEASRLAATVVRGVESIDFTISNGGTCAPQARIELSCAGQNPATCAFNPAAITATESSALTVGNLRALAGNMLNFDVVGQSGAERDTLGLRVLLADFAFTSAPDVATVWAGESANYALAIRSINGLTGTVALACTGAPRGASCAVTPATVALDGASLAHATVTVKTTARAVAGPRASPPTPWGEVWVAVTLALLLASLVAARRRVYLAGGLSLLLALLWAACGGGGMVSISPGGGTPPGTYTLTVSGTYTTTSSPLTNTTPLTLTVR